MIETTDTCEYLGEEDCKADKDCEFQEGWFSNACIFGICENLDDDSCKLNPNCELQEGYIWNSCVAKGFGISVQSHKTPENETKKGYDACKDLDVGKCEHYRKQDGISCDPFISIFAIPIASFEEAKLQCDKSQDCYGIYDVSCNGKDWHLCPKGSVFKSQSSCAYMKNDK